MEFYARLKLVRDIYVAALRMSVRKYRNATEPTEPIAVEIQCRPVDAPNPAPFSLARMDVLLGSSPKVRMIRVVDPFEPPREARAHHVFSGVRISEGGFGWEDFNISFSESSFEMESLRDWLDLWMDNAGRNARDDDGLLGVIHEINWHFKDPDSWHIRLDFGSAPLEAAVEFFAELARAGVRECVLEPPRDA